MSAERAAEYLALMRDVAIPGYRSTPGNRGAWCLHRAEGDIVHVETLSFWDDEASIRAFAGDEIAAAKYYDFDDDFLLEKEPHVLHFGLLPVDDG